jgi:hypothetical protein
MKVSSVSPERCETNCAQPASRQMRMASSVSLTVPIWLSLISAALPMLRVIASWMPVLEQVYRIPADQLRVAFDMSSLDKRPRASVGGQQDERK